MNAYELIHWQLSQTCCKDGKLIFTINGLYSINTEEEGRYYFVNPILEIENLKLSELKIEDLDEIIKSRDVFTYSEEQEDGYIFKIEIIRDEKNIKIDFYNHKIGKIDFIELKKELFYNENNLYALSHFLNNFFE